MNFKAVIFDMDGTLLDSLQGICNAMNTLLKEMNYPVHSLKEYRYFVGDGINDLIKRALPPQWHHEIEIENEDEKQELELQRLASEYRQIYSKVWPKKSPPYQGIIELLEKMEEFKIKKAILSNKSDDFTKLMAQKLLPSIHFDKVFGVRAGIPRKPHPKSALEIAAHWNLKPEEIIFLGDSGIDMETGINAKMFSVGVMWGFRDKNELIAKGAQKIIHHPMDLLEILMD